MLDNLFPRAPKLTSLFVNESIFLLSGRLFIRLFRTLIAFLAGSKFTFLSTNTLENLTIALPMLASLFPKVPKLTSLFVNESIFLLSGRLSISLPMVVMALFTGLKSTFLSPIDLENLEIALPILDNLFPNSLKSTFEEANVLIFDVSGKLLNISVTLLMAFVFISSSERDSENLEIALPISESFVPKSA